jgi:hypothetical protein
MTGFDQALLESAKQAGLLSTSFSYPSATASVLDFQPWAHSPYWLRVQASAQNSLLVRGIVNAHGLSGDRTDIHNIASAIWAICLQTTAETSLRIENEMHVVANETDARIITMAPFRREQEPIRKDRAALQWFKSVFNATVAAMPLITASFDDPYPESFAEKRPAWTDVVISLTGDDQERCSISHRLEQAIWQHFYSYETEIGVYRLTPGIMKQIRDVVMSHGAQMQPVIDAIESEIAKSPFKDDHNHRRRLAIEIANAVDTAINMPADDYPCSVLTMSHLFVLGQSAIVEAFWHTPSGNETDDD